MKVELEVLVVCSNSKNVVPVGGPRLGCTLRQNQPMTRGGCRIQQLVRRTFSTSCPQQLGRNQTILFRQQFLPKTDLVQPNQMEGKRTQSAIEDVLQSLWQFLQSL